MDDGRPGRVIVGVDTSLSGLQALRAAVAEARQRRAPLHAVRTWEPAPSDPGFAETRAKGPHGALASAASTVIQRAFAETFGGNLRTCRSTPSWCRIHPARYWWSTPAAISTFWSSALADEACCVACGAARWCATAYAGRPARYWWCLLRR